MAQTKIIKLELVAGTATPGPPIGALLGSKGIPAPIFVKQFNEQTQHMRGQTCGVTIYYGYDNKRSFRFEVGAARSATLIKEAISLSKGSAQSNRIKVAEITTQQLETIAEKKMSDSNAHTKEALVKMLAGTARSMGVTVKKA